MQKNHIYRLHWKLFFPLIGLMWLIIGITITYFVIHEKHRQKENLENRLLNVNNTVTEAYESGVDLQKTVDFIKLFTGKTTLDPLRITVYNDSGQIIADNPQATILIHDSTGRLNPELIQLWHGDSHATVHDMAYDNKKSMISLKTSRDGKIHSFAGLPYEGEVLDFLSIDPMVWIVVIILGIMSSVMAYIGVRAICRNVYALRDFARAIATDSLPDESYDRSFSKDELGDVSRNLIRIYRDKIHAEQEKQHHEHQIGINVSHELNTPVGIIKGYLDTVLGDPEMPEETKHKFLLRAQQNADRLASLVNDVGMVIRLGESTGAIPGTIIDFYEFTCRIAEDIKQGHIGNGMKFEFDVPKQCRIVAHEALLTNAVMNLAYNAGQHSGGTMMSLKWRGESDGMHFFSFADNGHGTEEEHIDRLFDMFYRVDTGRSRKNGGSGLGLPLVKKIITAMGGTITVENAEGGGLKFTFSLPAAQEET